MGGKAGFCKNPAFSGAIVYKFINFVKIVIESRQGRVQIVPRKHACVTGNRPGLCFP